MADKDTVYVNLFVSNETIVSLDDKQFTLIMESNFPSDNNINIEVISEGDKTISLALRIPSYAENYCVTINEKAYKFEVENGYAIVKGKFKNDKLKINFESPPRFVYANPLVRADSGKVAITKGPLVYCLEEIDNGDNLAAIFVDTSSPIVEKYEEELFGGVTTITVKGKKISSENWAEDQLYGIQKSILKEITLQAVPYCYWGNRKHGEMMVWIKKML